MKIIAVVSILVAGLGLLAGLALMWIGKADTYPGGVLMSPNREFAAHYYAVGGGGAAGWIYDVVSISRVDRTYVDAVRALQMRRGYAACIEWTGPRSLVVEIPYAAIVEQEFSRVVVDDAAISLEFARIPSTTFGEMTAECHGHKIEVGRPDSEWRVVK